MKFKTLNKKAQGFEDWFAMLLTIILLTFVLLLFFSTNMEKRNSQEKVALDLIRDIENKELLKNYFNLEVKLDDNTITLSELIGWSIINDKFAQLDLETKNFFESNYKSKTPDNWMIKINEHEIKKKKKKKDDYYDTLSNVTLPSQDEKTITITLYESKVSYWNKLIMPI